MLIGERNGMDVFKPYDAEVEWLESDGNGSSSDGQYINTNVLIPSDCTHVEYHFKFMFTSDHKQVFFGNQTQSHGNPRLYAFYTGSASKDRRFYAGNERPSISLYSNTVFEGSVVVDESLNELSVYGNGSALLSTTLSGDAFNRDFPVFIFSGSYGNLPDDTASVRVWYFKIIHGSKVVRDFIPVRVGTEGAMYDRVSNQLFRNQGTGAFGYGDDVVPVKYLQSTGVQYIDVGSIIGATSISIKVSATEIPSSGATKFYGIGYNANFQDDFGVTEAGWGGSSSYPCTIGESILFEANGDGLFINGTKCSGSKYFINSVSAGKKVFLFCGSNGTNAYITSSGNYMAWRGRIYSCKIMSGTSVMFDFIPVRAGSVGYMYDLVSRKQFTNGGTGSFTIGPDIKNRSNMGGGLN